MKLNKKEKNYLLSTLFKGYVIQCAICSVLIFGGTFLLGIMAEEILRKYVLYYYLYYRTVYLYIVAVIVWGGCIIYMTYLLLKKVVAYVYEVQAATGKMFDQNVSYIEMSPELSEIAANINQLKQEAESNARLAKENEQRKNDLIMYLAHDLKTPLSSVIGYLTLLRDESQISKELREKYLSITLSKAERLEDLINEFFEITTAIAEADDGLTGGGLEKRDEILGLEAGTHAPTATTGGRLDHDGETNALGLLECGFGIRHDIGSGSDWHAIGDGRGAGGGLVTHH